MRSSMMTGVLIGLLGTAPLAVLSAESPAPNPNGAAPAAKPAAADEAQIPFANHHGIYTWQVLNDRTLLIQSQSRQWYRATLMSPCFDLPFTERLAFKTNPDGSFDRFGAVIVRGQRCPLVSLVKSAPPAKPAKAKPGQKIAPPATTHAPEEGAAKLK